MRRFLTVLGSTLPAAFLAAQTSAPFDATSLVVGPPTMVAEIDLGRLKGELRRLAWSPDGTQFAIRTAEGDKPDDQVHFYTIADGAIATASREPEWASEYWAYKSDRSAPGLVSVMIEVEQGFDNIKIGTGSAGAIDGNRSDPGGMSAGNIDREAQRQKQSVVRLTLYGESVSQFVNERAQPGLQFSWGPLGSGAIAYVDPDGRMQIMDRQKHRKSISGVKDAVLPAWTRDGAKLAYLQKSGRKKYTLAWVPISH